MLCSGMYLFFYLNTTGPTRTLLQWLQIPSKHWPELADEHVIYSGNSWCEYYKS